MSDFGGEMRLQVDGEYLVLRANITNNPSNMSVAAIVNMNNTTDRQFTPTGYRAAVTFRGAHGFDWNKLLLGPKRSITLIEDTNGRLHSWNGAFFEGDVSVDLMTGEVTGLSIRADGYIAAAA